MKQEDRALLFKDLCGRVPYEVIVCIDGATNAKLASVSYWEEVEVQDGSRYLYDISDIKPYLFPLSSMTEEQYNEFFTYFHNVEMKEIETSGDYLKAAYLGEDAKRDWLNKNHFDYRYLIPMGLAKDATGLNIY